jgi:hypothetical protein
MTTIKQTDQDGNTVATAAAGLTHKGECQDAFQKRLAADFPELKFETPGNEQGG